MSQFASLTGWLTTLDWRSLLIGAALGGPVNILCGLYSGLVVARWAKFEILRTEVKRFILAIDWMYEDSVARYEVKNGYGELQSTISDLWSLQHTTAAAKAGWIQKDILDATAPTLGVCMDPETANIWYSSWQQACREMSPNLRVILSLT